MDIKGRWYELTWKQRCSLRRFAIAKQWKTYWGYKYRCLKLKEEKEEQT